MLTKHQFTLAATVGIATAGWAQTERTELPVGADSYRSGMPSVEAPPPAAPDADAGNRAAISRFADWSRSEGSPRILLFWNRQLSDESASRYEAGSEGIRLSGSHRGVGVEVEAYRARRERVTGRELEPMHLSDEVYENVFVTTFIGAGANLADRAALMRKASAAREGDERMDQQFMETLAVEANVDYVVEVNPRHSSGSDTGFEFAVKVLHVPTSRILAQFTTQARPGDGPERLVPEPGGFSRQQTDRNIPELVARELASETMRAIM